MLTLRFQTEPFWLEIIEGLRFHVRPCSSLILEQAQENVSANMSASAEMSARVRYVLLTTEIAKLVILDWEGVVDVDDKPIPVSVDTIDFALSLPLVNNRFAETYVSAGLRLGFEKKDYAPLPTGISEGALDTAPIAAPLTDSDAPPLSKTPATIP